MGPKWVFKFKFEILKIFIPFATTNFDEIKSSTVIQHIFGLEWGEEQC